MKMIDKDLELKKTLVIASGTILSIYILVLVSLGKSIFALTPLGYLFWFLPLWLLGLCTVLSVISMDNKIINLKINILAVLFSIGIFSMILALTLTYTLPKLFWA